MLWSLLLGILLPAGPLVALEAAEFHTYSPHEPHVDELYAAALDLTPIEAATHVATQDGPWEASATWDGGVPAAGSRVHIPVGITVTYDRNSEAALEWVRVDGHLRFATDRDTRLHLDTWVVSASGSLTIGTAADPIDPDHRVEVRFTNDGPLQQGEDPRLLGRGLIACGVTRMHGAEKVTWYRLANAPQAGERLLVLLQPPQGWRIGDRLMLPGWEEEGGDAEHETVTLEGVDGTALTVSPLASHHAVGADAPSEFSGHAINLSRNIVFANAEADADATPRSGYVSFMRSHDADIRYVEFVGLGRSDKRLPVDDPIVQIDGGDQVLSAEWEAWHLGSREDPEPARYRTGTGSNPRRRHSVQFYRHGSWHGDRSASVCKGCTMRGGQGWSFANIDSNVVFEDCAAVHFMAAGFATDIGAEQGTFRRNIAVDNGMRMSAKDGPRRELHDNGSSGDGFYFHGRNLVIEDNVAFDCHHGFVQHIRSSIYHTNGRGRGRAQVAREVLLMPPETAKTRDSIAFDACSLVAVRRNQSYGCYMGFRVIKSGDGLQHHDMRNRLYRLATYNCQIGIHITYVTKYTLVRPLIFGNLTHGAWNRQNRGILVGGRSTDTTIIEPLVIGYSHPAVIGGAEDVDAKGPADALIVGGNLDETDIYFNDDLSAPTFDPDFHVLMDSAEVVPGRLEFTQQTPGILPLPDELGNDKHFYLKGTRTDSLGSETLTVELDAPDGSADRASVWHGNSLLEYMETGYYLTSEAYLGTPAGTKVLQLTDLFVDRSTNDFITHRFLVSLPHDYGGRLGPSLGTVDPAVWLAGAGTTEGQRQVDLRLDLAPMPPGSTFSSERIAPSDAVEIRDLDADGRLEGGPFGAVDRQQDQVFRFLTGDVASDG